MQTGTTDIPLTQNGVRIVREMGPRVFGPNSVSLVPPLGCLSDVSSTSYMTNG